MKKETIIKEVVRAMAKVVADVKNFWKEMFGSPILAICWCIILVVGLIQDLSAVITIIAVITFITFFFAFFGVLENYKLKNLKNEGRTFETFMVCWTVWRIIDAIGISGIVYWAVAILTIVVLWFDIDPKKIWKFVKGKVNKSR